MRTRKPTAFIAAAKAGACTVGRNPNFNVVVDAAGGSRWWSWWLLLRLVLLGQRLDSDDGRSIRILHPFQGAQIHYPSLYCLSHLCRVKKTMLMREPSNGNTARSCGFSLVGCLWASHLQPATNAIGTRAGDGIIPSFCFKASNTPTGNDSARFSGRNI